MSILLKKIGTETIKFPNDLGMIFSGFNILLLSSGILLETLVIASILRVRQKTVDTLFVLSLCCADMLYNLYMLPSTILLLSAGGWGMGQHGCKLSTAMIIATLAISILSVTFITLNRYMAIIWKKNITRFQALVMIAVTWVSLFATVAIYGTSKEFSEDSIALQSSYTYCLLDYTSKEPIVVTNLIVQIVFMSIPMFFMILAYSQIILFYRKMNRIREYITSEVYNSERKLLIKAIAITSAFFLTYSIEVTIRVYEFITKADIYPIVDLIGAIGVNCNTLLNSILLLNFDGLVQSSAIELLGLEEWKKRRDQEKNSQTLKSDKKPTIRLINLKKGTGNSDVSTTKGPDSITTQKMARD